MADPSKENPSTRIGWVIDKHAREQHPFGAARAVIEHLHTELGYYRAKLEAAGQSPDTSGVAQFIDWLEGKYRP